jgi:hypothetical protein
MCFCHDGTVSATTSTMSNVDGSPHIRLHGHCPDPLCCFLQRTPVIHPPLRISQANRAQKCSGRRIAVCRAENKPQETINYGGQVGINKSKHIPCK